MKGVFQNIMSKDIDKNDLKEILLAMCNIFENILLNAYDFPNRERLFQMVDIIKKKLKEED